jgi:hypothetical protein
MNRRKFLTVSVLAPLARPPGCTAEPALDVSACLTPFCLTHGDAEYRKPLRSIFSIDGWRVATNGRVCVRAKDRLARRIDATAPSAENLNWSGPWGAGFRIEVFPYEPDRLPCSECGQRGPGPSQHYTDDAWCYLCEGEGSENNRTGELPRDCGGLRLRLWYVQLVMQLPDVVWHAPLVMPYEMSVGWEIPQGPVRFTWKGGDGLLMPMVKQDGTSPDRWLSAKWERSVHREN